ncbi:hypothetical protein [Pararhodonellum marinum]|uniref:hypothetical protein n=1 Tax=Pararhodonellum marinum TaxID=2755358 RepID=UPI00188ECA4B|nr:hypothetical protein [Pararhodonellum marinum]
MKKNIKIILLIFLSGSILQGCDLMEEDKQIQEDSVLEANAVFSTLVTNDPLLAQLSEFETVSINSYTVKFLGREFVNGSTTFFYTVSGEGKNPQLDSFFLEIPACAGKLIGRSPQNASGIEGNKVKWNASVSSTGSQNYSLTFEGDVSLGIIEATVTRGGVTMSSSVVGPCKGVSTLSGSIFIDSDANGKKEPSEMGLAGFPITVVNNVDQKVVAEVKTIDGGFFNIKVLPGNYTIRSADKLLNENYDPSTPIFIELNQVNENKKDLNFGYLPNSSKIINDIQQNVILLNTQPASFWISQLNEANKPRGKNKEAMLAILLDIENLLLPIPFEFGDNKIESALAILALPNGKKAQESESDDKKFFRQLLAAEMNVVSKRGAIVIVNGKAELADDFNMALLIYGEGIGCVIKGACISESGRIQSDAFSANSRDLIRSTDLLTFFNGTGGVR